MSDIAGTFEDRAVQLLSRVFRGMHHVNGLKKVSPRHWTCLTLADLSTFDFDTLTRLVLAAHQYCIRVSITQGGPRRLKIELHERGKRDGDSAWERHPDIREALARWEERK